MKFVEFHSHSFGLIPVNPGQVQFVRQDPQGATCLVFGAFPGGYHEIKVAGPVAEAVALLEGADRLQAMRIGVQGPPTEKRPPAKATAKAKPASKP